MFERLGRGPETGRCAGMGKRPRQRKCGTICAVHKVALQKLDQELRVRCAECTKSYDRDISGFSLFYAGDRGAEGFSFNGIKELANGRARTLLEALKAVIKRFAL